jgi:NitT/TauT family transport system ATP-binding protein
MNALEADNVHHEYRTTSGVLKVLDGVSFSLGSKEIATILGPSGCGKSTLLQCLAGLMKPTCGSITIFGNSPERCLAAKEVGYAFQQPSLLPWLTVRENVTLPARLGRKVLQNGEVEVRAADLIQMLNLNEAASSYPDELSVGMQHRVALARSLLVPSKVLYLDEPLAGLDLLTRMEIMIQMVRVFEHFACPTVIVTHSIEEAVFWGSRILILSAKPSHISSVLMNPQRASDRTLSYLDSPVFHELIAECRATLFKSQSSNV